MSAFTMSPTQQARSVGLKKMNLFYRSGKEEVSVEGLDWSEKANKGWYVQYRGRPDYDSGYTDYHFSSFEEAEVWIEDRDIPVNYL